MGGSPIRWRQRTADARVRTARPRAQVALSARLEAVTHDAARWPARLVPVAHPADLAAGPIVQDPPPADTIVEIYQSEHVALVRFARAATGDDEAAEDVLQESFVRLIREVAAGRRPDNVHAWLFRVATNLIVSQVRRARTAERHLADLGTDRLAESPEHYVLVSERDQAVRAALARLPLDGRAALLLAAQGFTGREIAVTLGRTEGAARTLLCRSRLKVRECLESDAGLRFGRRSLGHGRAPDPRSGRA